MKKNTIVATLAAAAAAACLAGCASTALVASAERPDCPGKIVCPLTGELVCADRCPLGAGERGEVALAVAPARSCCAAVK
jgi:hypothetical protein